MAHNKLLDTFDWTQPVQHVPWIKDATIYLTLHGSHAYGTSLPTSDVDFRGICVAPKEYYLGLSQFEQYAPKIADEDNAPDTVIFDLRKFVQLASICNANAIELIFTEPEDHLCLHPAAELLLANRKRFLSRKALKTFSGYARGQMHRINSHFKWLKNPLKNAPQRKDFGLNDSPDIPKNQLEAIEAAIQKQLDKWNLNFLDDLEPAHRIEIQEAMADALQDMGIMRGDLWKGVMCRLGFDTNVIAYLAKERNYQAEVKTWDSYQNWLKSRNEARSELERKYGYDTKHGSHLVRLMSMCRELLVTGDLHVKRPDASLLLDIRNGAWSYEKLVEYADTSYAELTQLSLTSPLPKQVDAQEIDNLCIQIAEMAWK